MRLALLVVALALAGCSARRATPTNATPGRQATPPNAIIGRTNAGQVIVTPAPGTVFGRIAHVNASDRFAVLTYPIGRVPPVGKRLSVYREGLKVGELKVTGPQHDPNTVADITAGEARAGDEVRDF